MVKKNVARLLIALLFAGTLASCASSKPSKKFKQRTKKSKCGCPSYRSDAMQIDDKTYIYQG